MYLNVSWMYYIAQWSQLQASVSSASGQRRIWRSCICICEFVFVNVFVLVFVLHSTIVSVASVSVSSASGRRRIWRSWEPPPDCSLQPSVFVFELWICISYTRLFVNLYFSVHNMFEARAFQNWLGQNKCSQNYIKIHTNQKRDTYKNPHKSIQVLRSKIFISLLGPYLCLACVFFHLFGVFTMHICVLTECVCLAVGTKYLSVCQSAAFVLMDQDWGRGTFCWNVSYSIQRLVINYQNQIDFFNFYLTSFLATNVKRRRKSRKDRIDELGARLASVSSKYGFNHCIALTRCAKGSAESLPYTPIWHIYSKT